MIITIFFDFAVFRRVLPTLLLGLLSACPVPSRAEDPSPDLEVMAAEMLMVGFRGTELTDKDPVMRALAGGKAGGVILFSRDVVFGSPRNVLSPEQVKALVSRLRGAAPGFLFVAVDQEGGRVQRLTAGNGFRDWPSPRETGEDAPEATYQVAKEMGKALADMGFNLNFAPSVDLDFPDSPAIGGLGRAYHRDPARVAAHAAAFVRGMEENGVLATLKHFPGHGSARGDTHSGCVDISAAWIRDELAPYEMLMAQGFDGMIMAAHVTLAAYGGLPADLNPEIINGLLRRDLGWQGVVVTDDMQMKAVAGHYDLDESILLAVLAGADILVFGNNVTEHDPMIAFKAHDALVRHVREGRIPEERIRESWRRIMDVKNRMRGRDKAAGGN